MHFLHFFPLFCAPGVPMTIDAEKSYLFKSLSADGSLGWIILRFLAPCIPVLYSGQTCALSSLLIIDVNFYLSFSKEHL